MQSKKNQTAQNFDAISSKEQAAFKKLESKFNFPLKTTGPTEKKETTQKKSKNFKEILSNTFSILKHKNNIVFLAMALVFFGLVYTFFYGFYTIPFLEIGFFKMNAPTPFDIAYIVIAVTLSGATITLFRHSTRTNMQKGALAGGILGGGFGIICPACLGANILLLGNVISLPLSGLIPYLWLFQIGSIGLLSVAFWTVLKNVSCKECFVKPSNKGKAQKNTGAATGAMDIHQYALFGLVIVAIGIFAFQLISVVGINLGESNSRGLSNAALNAAVQGNDTLNLDAIISEVLPEKGFTIEAKWGSIVKDMVGEGVLEPAKLEGILKQKYGQEIKPEWEKILAGETFNEKLTINAENAVFMMYLTWIIGKHNENQILTNSPFAKYFSNYDIGVGRAGYGDVKLISLSKEQQKIAEKVSLNSYRPCCGNSTGNPDCSHGFAALGLVELMASQGFSEEEIFDAFVKFNSFWFPSNYIQNAVYFKIKENKNWSEVDKELVAGKDFSSIQGSYSVKKFLEKSGI